MPDTSKQVRIVMGDHPDAPEDWPKHTACALVNGEPLKMVTEAVIKIDSDNGFRPVVQLTLIGVDVDLEGMPEYLVRVVGPAPPKDAMNERPAHGDHTESINTVRWMVFGEDEKRLRDFAGRNRLGDSAVTIRKLLDIAESAEESGERR